MSDRRGKSLGRRPPERGRSSRPLPIVPAVEDGAVRPNLAALLLLLVALPGHRADAADLSDEVIVLRRCAIGYARTTLVGSSMYGVLQDRLVEPGDRVKAGQVLGRLRDEDARAELRLRELEAESDVEIRLSEARRAQKVDRVTRTGALLRRKAASYEEYHLQQLEVEAATLEVEQARHRHQLAQVQVRQAQALLRAREFVSPHEGIVAAVIKRPREPVVPNETLFRVVDTDHIEVVGQVDVTDAWRVRVGQPVRVIPEVAAADLAVEHEVFRGRLVFVDGHIDPTTRTCRVTAQVDNRDGLLRSGLEARLEIHPGTAPDGEGGRGPDGPAPPPLDGPGARVRVGKR